MSIKWEKRKDFQHRYSLTGKYLIFVREENGDFYGRWYGLWDLPIKVLDYLKIAISVGGKVYWLQDHCKKFVYSLSQAEHFYKINNLKIKEKTFVFDDIEAFCDSLHIYNKDRKKIKIFVIPKFNLRLENNLIEDNTDKNPKKNQITIYDPNINALICRRGARINHVGILGSDIKPDGYYLGKFSEGLLTKDKWKKIGTSRSSYGISCLKYETNKKNFNLKIFLSSSFESEESALQTYKEALDFKKGFIKKQKLYNDILNKTTSIKTSNKELNKAFISSKINIEMLSHYQKGMGFGLFAGLPSYAMYFGRDLGWTMLGINPVHYSSYVRESLLLLARYQKRKGKDKGRIPHEIRLDGTVNYPSVDSTLLFILGVHDYYKWTGDRIFLQFINNNVKGALKWCFSRIENRLIPHRGEDFLKGTTWMDSHYRGKYAVDVQALLLKALECGEELQKERGDHKFARLCASHSKNLKETILRRFWNSKRDFFYDRIKPHGKKDDVLTVNPSLLLMFKYVDKKTAEKVLDIYESDIFTGNYGIRTRAKGEKGYGPNYYHKGSIWPLGTAWVAASEFIYGRGEKGYEYIKKLASLSNRFSLGTLHEVLPGEEGVGRLIKGCFIQSWSSSMLLYLTIKHLCGIEPLAYKNTLYIDPFLPQELNYIKLKNLSVANAKLDINYRREDDKIRIEILNKEAPIIIKTKEKEFELGKNKKRVIFEK